MNARRLSARLVSLLVFLLMATALHAQEPPSEDAAPKERAVRLAERDRLVEEAKAHEKEGRLEEAVRALEQVLAIEKELFGETREEVCGTLESLAAVEERLERFDDARERLKEVLRILIELHGPDHWKVTDARFKVKDLELQAGLPLEKRQLLAEARELDSSVEQLFNRGQYAEAVAPATRLIQIRGKIIGNRHPDYVSCLARSCRRIAQVRVGGRTLVSVPV